MNGITSSVIYLNQSRFNEGTPVEFEAENTVNSSEYIVVQTESGISGKIPKASVQAIHCKTLEDSMFLMKLEEEVQAHDRILFFQDVPNVSAWFYVFETDNLLEYTSTPQLKSTHRGIYANLIYDIALEMGKPVYVARRVVRNVKQYDVFAVDEHGTESFIETNGSIVTTMARFIGNFWKGDCS